MSETKRLGRGLEALLGPITREDAAASGTLRELAVAAIGPNPYQPRRDFDEAQLGELADSIAASGLLQPVVVRPGTAGRYELIAGERRWRAVQRLGWKKISAVVKEADDRALLTLALIENLQRDDLSPLDAAVGYKRLMAEFALPQQEVARLSQENEAWWNSLTPARAFPSTGLADPSVSGRKLLIARARSASRAPVTSRSLRCSGSRFSVGLLPDSSHAVPRSGGCGRGNCSVDRCCTSPRSSSH